MPETAAHHVTFGFICSGADIPPGLFALVSSPCSRCLSEYNEGSRAEALLCTGWRELVSGGMTCGNCGHSWKEHA